MWRGRASGSRLRLCVAWCVVVLASMFMTPAGAGAVSGAQPAFSAHGSVEQVYVTGVDPATPM
jgi:hypothetical protein